MQPHFFSRSEIGSVADRPSWPNLCQMRGYCGPFENEAYFYGLSEPSFRGCANCIHCGLIVRIWAELDKWEHVLAAQIFSPSDSAAVAVGGRP
jgi:hypothetical protein